MSGSTHGHTPLQTDRCCANSRTDHVTSPGPNQLGFIAGLEQRQCGLGEVALVGDLPFVVGFDEHRAGQAQQGSWVREDADDIGAA